MFKKLKQKIEEGVANSPVRAQVQQKVSRQFCKFADPKYVTTPSEFRESDGSHADRWNSQDRDLLWFLTFCSPVKLF